MFLGTEPFQPQLWHFTAVRSVHSHTRSANGAKRR
jgi:hypothetical protein